MESVGTWGPMAMQIGATALSASGKASAGNAAEEVGRRKLMAAEYEAAQLRQDAGQLRAASQHDALDQERQAALIQSRFQAIAAASGGGMSDPTVVNVIGRIAAEGKYRSMLALYQGEAAARKSENAAAATEWSGETAKMDADVANKSAHQGSLATILSGSASLFGKYGGSLPGAAGGGGMAPVSDATMSSIGSADFTAGWV